MAGLACARTLVASGLDVVVLEASDGVGGRVRSDRVDGYTLDRGFQILLTAYPELARWFDIAALDLKRFLPGATIWTGDGFRSVGDPLRRPSDLPATIVAPIGSVTDKLRLLKLLMSVRRGSVSDLLRRPDSSTRSELERRGFSPRFIARFFEPLFAGIQLDPDLEVSSRRFSVILRMLATGDATVPAQGMGTLSQQLAEPLASGVVRLVHRVDRVDGTTARCIDGSSVSARALVVATHGPAAADLLGLPDPGSRPVAALWFDATDAPVHDRRILLDGADSGPVKNLAVQRCRPHLRPARAKPPRGGDPRRSGDAPRSRIAVSTAAARHVPGFESVDHPSRRCHPPWPAAAAPTPGSAPVRPPRWIDLCVW